MQRIKTCIVLSCIGISLQAAGAASSSQNKSQIILKGSKGARVSIPQSFCNYSKLLKDLTEHFQSEQIIPLKGRNREMLEYMKRLLSLRAEAKSSEQLQKMITKDARLCTLDEYKLRKLFKFGNYMACDKTIMYALGSLCMPYYTERLQLDSICAFNQILKDQKFFLQVDADNEKLLMDSFFRNIATKLFSRIFLQQRILQRPCKSPFFSPVLAYSPDSKTIASKYKNSISSVQIWSIKSGTSIKILRSRRGPYGSVESLAYSPDGKRIVSGAGDGMHIWDIETGACIYNLRAQIGFSAVAYSHDGRRVILGSWCGTVRILDIEKGSYTHIPSHKANINFVAFGPEDRTVISGSHDGKVCIFDLETNICVAELSIGDMVTALAYSPDGKRIVSGYLDGAIRIWDIGTKVCICEWQGHTSSIKSISYSPDAKMIISGANTMMHIWESETGTCQCILQGPGLFTVMSVIWSPDGKNVAAGFFSGLMRIWPIDYMKDLQTITDINEQRFLIKAAVDWSLGRPHEILSINRIYKKLVSRFSYLNDTRLFALREPTLQEEIAELKAIEAETDDYSVLDDQVFEVYDHHHYLQKYKDPTLSDDAILREFMDNFTPRAPIWRILFEARDMLGSDYEVKREERKAQAALAAQPEASAATSSSEASSSSEQPETGVRPPDMPYMMRLLDDADPNQL